MVLRNNHFPKQGEVWLFDPDPVRGNEIGKKIRPAVVVSCDLHNDGFSGLVIIVPMTSREKKIFSHVRIDPPEGGLEVTSFAMCEQMRSVSKDRLVKKLGKIRNELKMKTIHQWLLDLLRL